MYGTRLKVQYKTIQCIPYSGGQWPRHRRHIYSSDEREASLAWVHEEVLGTDILAVDKMLT